MKKTIFAIILVVLSYNASSMASAAKKDDAKSGSTAQVKSSKENAEAAAKLRSEDTAKLSALLTRRCGNKIFTKIICFRPDAIHAHREARDMGIPPRQDFGETVIGLYGVNLYDQNEKTPKYYSSAVYIDSDNKQYKVFNPSIHENEEQRLDSEVPVGYKARVCGMHKHFDPLL